MLNTDAFSHDAASNATGSGFVYNENNQLTSFNGSSVTYDADGNMVSCGSNAYTYNSVNQLLTAGGHTYTYNGDGVRLSNITATTDIRYAYDTNAALTRMLQKTENGTVTKYVYGHGLIGEESGNTFKTYHFDSRGSTVAITNASGTVTDTFAYDTYGALTARTGSTPIIFGYNGRDGVVTDANGLLYMRARYYSPAMRRFINADVLVGSVDESATLNRYAYANGNPVMNVDPLGLASMSKLALDDKRFNENVKGSYSKTGDTFVGNCTRAVLVTNFALELVGHAEIYFQDENENWFLAEFNLREGGGTLVESAKYKGEARIYWERVDALPFYNSDQYEYVELTGNFNKSVAMAQVMSQERFKDFEGYNFLFNNCADYTDFLLDFADVDGMFSQMMIANDDLISIPRIQRELIAVAKSMDLQIRKTSEDIKDIADEIEESDFLGSNYAAHIVSACGNLLVVGTNYIGDAIASKIDMANLPLKPVKNIFKRRVDRIWNRLKWW